jgi:hypothetical protein
VKAARRPPADALATQFAAYLVAIPKVFHVGTMDRSRKRRGSLEGAGLSVSVDPEAWRGIARLGDAPTFALRRAAGTFVEVHSARADGRLLDTVIAWAQQLDYLGRGELVELHCQTDSGETVAVLFDTREEAEGERQALGALEAPIVTTMHHLMTAKMAERAWAARMDDHGVALVHALSFFVEDNLPDVDGLWWQDTDDPLGLSAPRGVIYPSRLLRWRIERHPATAPG